MSEHIDPTDDRPERDRPDPVDPDRDDAEGDIDVESCRGRLLVAMPMLSEGTFWRSVVLLLDHDEDGALGVILNHPVHAQVDDVLPDWSDLVAEPDALFEGGPVATDSALAVGLLSPNIDDTPLGWRQMFGRVGLVDLDVPVAAVEDALVGLRVFAGYAGWGAGQLEAEIEEGSWIVVDSIDNDLLVANPWNLWREVLRRQDSDLRMLSTYPDDPAMN